MHLKEIFTVDEMLQHLLLVQQLYSDLTKEKYEKMLREMIPNHYSQVVVFENEKAIDQL